jgi:hypothetical protein
VAQDSRTALILWSARPSLDRGPGDFYTAAELVFYAASRLLYAGCAFYMSAPAAREGYKTSKKEYKTAT